MKPRAPPPSARYAPAPRPRREAIIVAASRDAEGIMALHRGELADAEHLAREADPTSGNCGS